MSANVPRTSALVVGAGHAGLAVSHYLAACSIDHQVVERGEVGHSWRTERWDSLRLLTPNWQARVPGLAYDGEDPDGFMDMAEVVSFLERYARLVGPPLETRTTVESVRKKGAGYEVVTDRGVWHAATVVLASGGCNVAKVPPFAAALPELRRAGDADGLPPSLGPPRWRGSRRGRLRDRGPDRGRGPSLRDAR